MSVTITDPAATVQPLPGYPRYLKGVSCEVCGGPVGNSNKSGVCSSRPACKRRNAQINKQRNRDTADRGQKRRYNSPEGRARALWHLAKRRAKDQCLPFNIEIADLLPFPEVCPVLGIPIVLDDYRAAGSPQLDRVVPVRGYVHGNVQIMSSRANRLKSDATAEELDRIAAWIRSESCR